MGKKQINLRKKHTEAGKKSVRIDLKLLRNYVRQIEIVSNRSGKKLRHFLKNHFKLSLNSISDIKSAKASILLYFMSRKEFVQAPLRQLFSPLIRGCSKSRF